MADLTDVYGAIATYAGQVSGIGAGLYPAPGAMPTLPALVVMSGAGTITHGPTQMWLIRVRAHLIVAMDALRENEITAADALLMPIVDAFAADTEDTDGFTLGGLVDRCVVSDFEPLSLLAHAGLSYIGYPVFFDVKLHRHAGG